MARYKGLSKTRPKKKQVAEVVVEFVAEAEAEDSEDAERAVPRATTPPEDEVAAAAEVDSPRSEQLEKLEQFFDTATKELNYRQKVLRHFKKQHKLAERLHNAKMKRWDDKKRWPSQKKPFLAAARMYESIIEHSHAELKLALAERDVARAEVEQMAMQMCIDRAERE